ncbi:MAG: cell wall-binding repeat-containing protein [Pseudolysinimonas sp.]
MGEKSLPSIRRRLIGAAVAITAVLGALLVPLSAQAAATVTVSDAVARILSDTNALRVAGGLAPLTESTAIDTVAQNWSAQMYAAGALTHNPNYSTQIPSGWNAAGENIATGFSYTTVVEAWHQSAGHYANIMGNYNAIGIGYYEANGQTYFTQDFGNYATVPSPKAAPAPVVTVADSSASTAPTPVVSGTSIVNSRTGTALTVHAVNWPSFEYACQQGWGNSADGTTAAAANAMASWGINAVRIPLNQDCWLGVDGAPRSPVTVAGYKSALSAWVSTLNAAGLVVILDLHWTAPSGSAADGQRAMPDAQSTTFWTSVATFFKDSKSVMFETFNEPYSRGSRTVSWSCWLNGGCQVPVANDQSPIGTTTYTAVGQAALVAAIRATGATQPILLDGLNYANDITGWLANKPNDSQLIASWHNYVGQGCSDTTCWNAQILPVAASVPVIATEFGETDGGSSFLTGFMNWADAHGIGYAPWAWWVTDASDGTEANLYSLISNLSSFTPRAPEGTAYHDHLATLGITVDRVGGTDRYAVAINIAQAAYPSGAPDVYVATGLNFPDALSAGAAAAKNHSPVLLTDPNSLSTEVANEITALHPGRIIVVGGTASVTDTVYRALEQIQPNIVRLAGIDRYAASRAIVASEFSGGADTVYIATGATFPDALSAAAAGGPVGAAVLLVNGSSSDGLDAASIATLTALHPSHIIVAGGTGSVSPAIQSRLNLIARTTRYAGEDRYSASTAISVAAYQSADRVFLTTGLTFPDALGGSAWAGAIKAPLFVVPTNCVPAPTLAAIHSLGATRVTLLGGPASLTAAVAALKSC